MLLITSSAAQSLDDLNKALEQWEGVINKQQGPFDNGLILNPVQNIVQQGASLSRYFWPSDKAEAHQERARFLREQFGMKEESPLKSRTLRNTIEHFDKELDRFVQKVIAGHVVPQFVGDLSGQREVPIHVFRAFDPFTYTFEILGERFAVEPIVDELMKVHSQLATRHET